MKFKQYKAPQISVFLTNLGHLSHNYGAQGIAFPFMEKLSKYFNADYIFVSSNKDYEKDLLLSKKHGFHIINDPYPYTASDRYFLISFLYRLLKRKKADQKKYSAFIAQLKKSDVIVDLSGIEFIGNLKKKWLNYIHTTYMQYLAKKYNKLYLKYTKSYGPFTSGLYCFFVKMALNKLPFVFVRGTRNLKSVRNLKLKVPCYSFPDISLVLSPKSRCWANKYLIKLGLSTAMSIIGISPSSVIDNMSEYDKRSSSSSHILLCKKMIKYFQSKNRQVLLIPHSLEGKTDLKSCDLELSKKIYNDLKNKNNIFVVTDMLTYRQVKSLIGVLEFYITGRYHSVSSALSMGVPVVPLSWHVKYKDIMSLFLNKFLIIDCRHANISKTISLIKKYHSDLSWFNKKAVMKRKKKAACQIDKSIKLLSMEIKRALWLR